MEQAERGRNLILTGPNCDVSIPAIVNELNKQLGTKLKEEHLHYVTRLKSEGPKKMKVLFYSKVKRDQVFREKRRFEGEANLVDRGPDNNQSQIRLSRQAGCKKKDTHIQPGLQMAVFL